MTSHKSDLILLIIIINIIVCSFIIEMINIINVPHMTVYENSLMMLMFIITIIITDISFLCILYELKPKDSFAYLELEYGINLFEKN